MFPARGKSRGRATAEKEGIKACNKGLILCAIHHLRGNMSLSILLNGMTLQMFPTLLFTSCVFAAAKGLQLISSNQRRQKEAKGGEKEGSFVQVAMICDEMIACIEWAGWSSRIQNMCFNHLLILQCLAVEECLDGGNSLEEERMRRHRSHLASVYNEAVSCLRGGQGSKLEVWLLGDRVNCMGKILFRWGRESRSGIPTRKCHMCHWESAEGKGWLSI